MIAGEHASKGASDGTRDVCEMRVESWDLFCRVVDNYGDIGVAWRLARQLASDARRSVRLFVDDLQAFARVEPRVDADADADVDADADADAQCRRIDAIEVSHWRAGGWNDVAPADVVIELFGCGLPPKYLDAMARAGERGGDRAPVWIDLEYLSAETWVDEFHGLPSPHPTLPLVKHFFYPGFSAQTGGVLIETGLDEKRHAFVEDIDQVAAFWRRLYVPLPAANEKRVSLFAYANEAVSSLFESMASDPHARWSVVVPDGVSSREIEAFANVRERGSLSIFAIPFIAQDDYDRLLWSCDVNFVRGEDSFVRAQWAARPFIWHIYPQSDDAHFKKLIAFEDRYEADLPQAVRDAQRALWLAWNAHRDLATAGFAKAWARWCDALPELSAHAEVWRQSLASHKGLVDSLAAFVAERRAALLK